MIGCFFVFFIHQIANAQPTATV